MSSALDSGTRAQKAGLWKRPELGRSRESEYRSYGGETVGAEWGERRGGNVATSEQEAGSGVGSGTA